MALSSQPVALFAVALVALGMVVRDAAGQPVRSRQPAPSDPDLPRKLAPDQTRIEHGFRMEGAAEVELLFGDSDIFRAQIDRFHTLHDRMDTLRRTFSRHAAETLGALPRDDRYCPDTVAVSYYRAWLAGHGYEDMGREFEAVYRAVQRLDDLGESIGLPPGYRWKVERAHEAYRTTLVDHGEMRAIMDRHLAPELRFRRCRPEVLLREGAQQAPGGLATNAPPASAAVTFFIDNRECAGVFHLIFDDALLGNVIPHQKVAFQTTAGRHTLCLIEPSSDLTCGDPGTVRMAHVYNGWSMTTHCR